MDPNATWAAMVGAMRDGDVAEAHDRAMDLVSWWRRGGFRPAECPERLWVSVATFEAWLGCLCMDVE